MANHHVYSTLGIGFGPANLSLAVALDELGQLGDVRFIEKAPDFQWQDEQLLPGADIQNNPLRDLATQRNPDSEHTFIKYLASSGGLIDYLHLNSKFPLRRQYAGYLAWVAAKFRDHVDYGQAVTGMSLIEYGDEEVIRVETDAGHRHLARTVVLGAGRSPRVPEVFRNSLGRTVFHSSRYLSSMRELGKADVRVVVVGASQSAIEIALDLLERPHVKQVTCVHRGIGFRLKDTSPYSRRVFLPEFVDYFHPLPEPAKTRLRAELRSINYGACDQDVIDRLATVQHEYGLTGSDRLRLLPFSQVVDLAQHSGTHRLVLRDVNHLTDTVLDADVIVLGTGFRDFGAGSDDERCHPLLSGIVDRMALTEYGIPAVERDYSVRISRKPYGPTPPRLYLNGLCEASHGMGDAGALAMLSGRSTDIAATLVPGDDDSLLPAQAEIVRALW